MTSSLSRLLTLLLLLAGLQQWGSALLIHGKAQLASLLLERAWRQSLAQGGAAVKPWPWADTWPVVRLEVPALGESHLVLAGDSGNALAFGPGHLRASAMPGTGGTTVISGHRDTHFHFLGKLRSGQRINVQLASGRSVAYRVAATDIVDASRGGIVAGREVELLLLVTCYPFDALVSGGPLRFRVMAVPEREPVLSPLPVPVGRLEL
ncbi:class GN sortase [Seongchinamella sediminis]|uniref:class GN sortase n=1 Tax=Seongchinamella sediminis TaxID=2283635 RepID=UPI001EEF838C|nr:class GN sortase [Seongchinamella sediminis]